MIDLSNRSTDPLQLLLEVADLEAAAFNYVKAKRDLQGAESAGIPDRALEFLRSNVSAALKELLMAAEVHFDNSYDGATE